MTRRTVSLGSSPAEGKAAFDQVSQFKNAVWRKIGRNAEGAWLVSLYDPDSRKREVAVHFEDSEPGGVIYARRCQELAPGVWEEVSRPREKGR